MFFKLKNLNFTWLDKNLHEVDRRIKLQNELNVVGTVEIFVIGACVILENKSVIT